MHAEVADVIIWTGLTGVRMGRYKMRFGRRARRDFEEFTSTNIAVCYWAPSQSDDDQYRNCAGPKVPPFLEGRHKSNLAAKLVAVKVLYVLTDSTYRAYQELS